MRRTCQWAIFLGLAFCGPQFGQAQLRKAAVVGDPVVAVEIDPVTGTAATTTTPIATPTGTATGQGERGMTEEEAVAYLKEEEESGKGSFFGSLASPMPAESANGTLNNWGQTYYFKPAKIVHAYTYEDVQNAIRDTATYPSPVRALGIIHSVTYLTVNEGGTVVLMRRIKGIKDFGYNPKYGHHTVTALAGTTSKELYDWLGEKGFECGFQAEIGDATVGSLAVSQNKDSGLFPRSEMGTTYKGIVHLKIVDHLGNVRDINIVDNKEEIAYFKASDGLVGIVLEVTYKVFPQRLVATHFYATDTMAMVKDIHNLVTEDRTAWMLLSADITQIETRRYAGPNEEETPAMCEMMKRFKQLQFQRGETLTPEVVARNVPFYYNCWRRTQVVTYRVPGPGEPRQDFIWLEYPYERFEEVVYGYVALMKDFAARHNGWKITGAGVYFVERIPEKPHGWFSMQGKGFDHKGLSFNMDPIYTDPHDPLWYKFIEENKAFALAHGGRFSLVQTRELTPAQYFAGPGNVPIPQAPNKRFTTPFLEGFAAQP